MQSALDLLPRRSHQRFFRQICAALTPVLIGFAVILAAPLSAPQAKTDCSSLEIELDASAEFTTVECDQANRMGGDISASHEDINAGDSQSVFLVRHVTAGNRTYLIRSNPKTLVEPAFANAENWATAPGGNGFAVMRFRGWLKNYPDLPLSCFAFARYSGHVDRTTGYRHSLSGFYCANQPNDISEAETRRLIGAIKHHFE